MAAPDGGSVVYLLEFVGEDDTIAAVEARSAAQTVRVLAPGVALATGLSLDRTADLAFTRRACRFIGRCGATVAAARRLLVSAPLVDADDGSRSVAVRARDIRGSTGVSTAELERALGDVLVDRGYTVDLENPDRELYVFCSDTVCLLGWRAVAPTHDFAARMPTDRPFFQPGSMAPRLARALVNIALPADASKATLVDPMCGTGGIALEAALIGADPIGIDAQRKMVFGSRQNARSIAPDRNIEWLQSDATRLPLADGIADAIVFDAPYGRQSKVVGASTADLVSGALREARRVLGDGRAVMVGDRDWERVVASSGFSVVERFDRRVHRSLTRHIAILE